MCAMIYVIILRDKIIVYIRKVRFFIVKYIAIACLLVMSALFSSMETAFSTVNKIRLKHQAANGSKKAERALKIAENFDKALTTILVGNNIVNILSSSLGTVIFTELFGAAGVAISLIFAGIHYSGACMLVHGREHPFG